MGACATKPAVLKDAEIDGAPAPEVKGEEAAPATAVVELVKEVVVIEEDVISIVADASIDIKPRSLSNLFEEGEVIKQATGDHELPIAVEPISVEPEIKEEKADQKQLVDEKPVEEKLKTETKQDIEKPNVNITIIEETTKNTKEKEPVVVLKEKDIAVEEKPKTETKTKEKEVVVVQTAEKVIEKIVEPVPKITNKEKEVPVVEIKAAIITAEVKTVNPVEEKPKSETLKSVDTKPPQEITEKTGTSQQKTEVKPATVVVANEKK
ncbi:von Willebrand factor A domain-containing protein DDB_G0286969-like [Impatiens glandulifera]|uniref:von Willebrand factor A domain-containing protein DDB_G0286969-like n=1 Tax=Impatiens glandulifera TaxID=253017 RepID=UPI001FB0AA65|nr:von Willebrand factor A domain-containing protein DDB_G0286969-like [Impatiens glandulifera]